jgi:hypothetical protein
MQIGGSLRLCRFRAQPTACVTARGRGTADGRPRPAQATRDRAQRPSPTGRGGPAGKHHQAHPRDNRARLPWCRCHDARRPAARDHARAARRPKEPSEPSRNAREQAHMAISSSSPAAIPTRLPATGPREQDSRTTRSPHTRAAQPTPRTTAGRSSRSSRSRQPRGQPPTRSPKSRPQQSARSSPGSPPSSQPNPAQTAPDPEPLTARLPRSCH